MTQCWIVFSLIDCILSFESSASELVRIPDVKAQLCRIPFFRQGPLFKSSSIFTQLDTPLREPLLKCREFHFVIGNWPLNNSSHYLQPRSFTDWIKMALQNNQGIQNMPQDDELILLEEKIYLLPGAKPKANGRHSLPVIGSKTNRDEGKQNLFSRSSVCQRNSR